LGGGELGHGVAGDGEAAGGNLVDEEGADGMVGVPMLPHQQLARGTPPPPRGGGDEWWGAAVGGRAFLNDPGEGGGGEESSLQRPAGWTSLG